VSPRKRELRFTDEALLDLEDILTWTQEEWSSRRRVQCRQTLMKSLRTLASSPFIGREREDLTPGLRSHPLETYIVFYSATDVEVRIWRVLRSRRRTRRVD